MDAPTRADMAKLNERGNRNSRLFTEKTMTMADWFRAPNSPERNLRPSLAHSSKQKMRRPLKANLVNQPKSMKMSLFRGAQTFLKEGSLQL